MRLRLDICTFINSHIKHLQQTNNRVMHRSIAACPLLQLIRHTEWVLISCLAHSENTPNHWQCSMLPVDTKSLHMSPLRQTSWRKIQTECHLSNLCRETLNLDTVKLVYNNINQRLQTSWCPLKRIAQLTHAVANLILRRSNTLIIYI